MRISPRKNHEPASRAIRLVCLPIQPRPALRAKAFSSPAQSLLERGVRTPTFFVIVSLAEGPNTDPIALFGDAVARLRGQMPPR